MRIQMHYGGQVTNPCSAFNYGEVEDYTINISGWFRLHVLRIKFTAGRYE